ncbi:chromatin modification-related protein EAF1 B-like isoform X4 [Canna indica]|uniref:Chromatin modification-related protein EAF1 B-like isoform X4 n=1 Tax=Canna indica TaxID=4628 RepID=A0AAQ3JS10_9LILI|nr:chromatin modification-related protein EAF1 B-like isoform X4 [Canna indica]
MGGVIECGLGVDTKTSPHRVAIEKAQAELQQEFDSREERRRELEFLEKGGNPLDFKFIHGASISVQSTSHADQHGEPYFTSEAKGSLTLAASPHGDSLESSGRPIGLMGREPNTGDNLLLLDGENNKLLGERNTKHRGKRGSAALLEHSSQVDGCHNAKEADDSAIFRLGAKSQAYARRNRSRKSRDSTNLGLTDSGSRHGNKASNTSSYIAGPRGTSTKESLSRLEAEDHSVASISNLKVANLDGITKALVADDQADVQSHMVQNNNICTDMIIDVVPEGEKEIKICENLQGSDLYNQNSSIAEKAPRGSSSQSCDISGKGDSLSAGPLSVPLESNESKDTCSAGNINGLGSPDKTMTSFHEGDLSHKNSPEGTTNKNLSVDITNKSNFPNGTCKIENTDGDRIVTADGMSGGDCKDQMNFEGSMPDNRPSKENELPNADVPTSINASTSIKLNLHNSVVQMKDEACDSRVEMLNEVAPVTNSEPVKLNNEIICEPEKKMDNSISEICRKKASLLASSLVSSSSESPKVFLKGSAVLTTELQTSIVDQKKAHEEAILKEARIIEARIKRARDLPASNKYLERRQKCHWDFVLEEMTWMANDFMQERLWKTATASQVSQWIASCGRAKFEQVNIMRKQKYVARSLARAVLHFWHAAEVTCTGNGTIYAFHHECKSDTLRPSSVNEAKAGQTVQDYAVRYLKHYGSTSSHSVLVEAPTTPDCQNDSRILKISWEDQHKEESLFYKVPPGAMQAYREAMESQWIHYKKYSVHQDDCETSMCNSVAGGLRENVYEEDEAETGTYLLPGTFEVGLSSKLSHKKRKHVQQKSSVLRLNEGDFSYEPCLEGKSGNQPFMSNGKRTPSTFNVGSFPTKRVRTASRQRLVSPYPSGVIGSVPMTSKTDASSEDTSSFLDEQSSLHGGSMPRKNSGFETTMDFERQLPFDGNEISSKSKKKKKKPKHLGYRNSLNLGEPGILVVPGKGSSYERRLQADPVIQHEQKELVKKRMESQHFDSNGGTVYGQHASKKPKEVTQVTGSLPSPVASQMSNMSNSNKFIKIIANRDRARKNKAPKMAAGQSGSGSPWSNFEDQALVVLVHDMGPNWELVSDAINNTLQFKCIFRKPRDCKERHKFLMDKSAGDGADSAEDSGSSQPYPSTLPGIPKGSARQLFQRLQGPMEEDILKTHFEKIILLGQKLTSCSRQESKLITSAHNSHVVALSQVCPNNLSGGILTPLDLCESISPSPDVFPLAYQGPHTGSLSVPSHQPSMSPVLPTSAVSTVLQGSPGTVLSNSLPSASSPLNPSSRDSQRYSMTRPSGVPVDDSQRMQQYSQMLSGRTLQQSNMSLPGALPIGADRGVRMLPGASGMGMMPGMNRGMPMSRPSFQGISPPSMLNMVSTGNMISSGGHGVQNPVNVHPSVISSPGNSMMRPRDPLQMLRPGQNPEEHRHMMMQELQMQASQTNGQSVPPFSGISASFSNSIVPSSIQAFPVQQHQQSHQMLQQPHILGNPHHHPTQGTSHPNSLQQPYPNTMRASKERQLQHQMMPQTQHSGPNATSTTQNNSQISPQSQSCSPVTPVSSSQGQHKQQNISRNPPSGMSNQMTKQRQRQQVQHNQPRQQQQQRQQAQQPAKLMKGLGRGSMLIHHNISADASQVGGISTASKNQVSDKHMMQQGQGFFPGSSGLNSTLNQPGNQKNMYPHPLPQSTKQISPISDTCNQGSAQSSPSHNMLNPQQTPIASSISLPKQHQQPQQQRYLNQSQQSIQRIVLQQNRHMNSDGRMQSSTDQSQVAPIVTSSSVAPTDSSTSATVGSSATLWNPEPSYDKDAPNQTSNVVSSAPETLVGSEASVPSSSQSLLSHQLPGVSVHGHGRNVGGQWQQQQQPPPPPPQHQQEQQHSRHSDLGVG